MRSRSLALAAAAVACVAIASCGASGPGLRPPSGGSTSTRMRLVLAAPSVNDPYYRPAFQEIVDFQIGYAKAIEGKDEVVLLVDKATMPYYENRLPPQVLLQAEIADIWMRDFTTVDPIDPVEFVYTSASTQNRQESAAIQDSFNVFADRLEVSRKRTTLVLDGGNIVDSHAGRVVTTTRFMEDNNLSYDAAKQALKDVLGASEVAIIEPDEDALAHSDGMVMWAAADTLLVNDYSAIDPRLQASVKDELRQSFPGVKIVEVPVVVDDTTPPKWKGFSSACGVNLNSVLTNDYIYTPTFETSNDKKALAVIAANTTRQVVPVDARAVCPMGGSVRCLTWQVTGQNANRILTAAARL